MNFSKWMQAKIFVLVCLLFINVSAISADLKGKVINVENKETIPGVTIKVKNTVFGTLTDINGKFILKNVPDSAIVVFSYVGFKPYELDVISAIGKDLVIELLPTSISLDEVVIVTTKNQLKSFEQTTPVSLVTEEKIEDFSTQNITDIVTRQPSVSLAGAGYHKVPSIRGLARKRVVMLVDGARISSERNPGAPGSFVNPLDIKNIEILRGPYSTLYGSDAVGGVVNIITKEYEKPLTNDFVGGTFSANYQSIRNSYNTNLILNSKIADKVFFHATIGKREGESYKDANGDEVMSTNFSEKSATGKITYQIHQNHKLQITGLISEADSIGKPAFNDSINALHPKDDHYKIGVNYQWNNISKWLAKMNISASAHKHEITARIFNYRNIQFGRVVNKRKNLYNDDYVYQHDFTFIISPKIRLLSGFDYYKRDGIHIDEQSNAFLYLDDGSYFKLGDQVYEGSLDTVINDSYQESLGFFAQANYNLSKVISMNAGMRWNKFATKANLTNKKTYMGPPYDYSLNEHETRNKEDEAINGNFGLNYKPFKYLSFTANIGQAFRVPSTKELFVNTMTPGGLNISNDSLVPEESLNIDFGIKLVDKKQNTIAISLFRNKIDDMIVLEWDSSHASGKFENKNALVYGGELTFDLNPIQHLYINGNLSYVEGIDDKDSVLMDILPFQANLETRYFIKPKKLFVAFAARYNSEQKEVVVGDVPTDSFIVFDFLSGWKINKFLKANFSITNLFNEDYREHYQFDWVRQPGRSYNAGLQFNF